MERRVYVCELSHKIIKFSHTMVIVFVFHEIFNRTQNENKTHRQQNKCGIDGKWNGFFDGIEQKGLRKMFIILIKLLCLSNSTACVCVCVFVFKSFKWLLLWMKWNICDKSMRNVKKLLFVRWCVRLYAFFFTHFVILSCLWYNEKVSILRFYVI